MFVNSVYRCARSISRNSLTSHVLKNVVKQTNGRSAGCGVTVAGVQVRLLRVTSTQSSLVLVQEKLTTKFPKASCSDFVAQSLLKAPQLLTGEIVEGAGTESDIADDDDEMSSVGQKKKRHRRKLEY